MMVQTFLLLAGMMIASGSPVEPDCTSSGTCSAESSSLLATKMTRAGSSKLEEAQVFHAEPPTNDPVAIPLIDDDVDPVLTPLVNGNGTAMLQVSCEPPPGVTCVCDWNPDYPCYRAYGDSCGCWSHKPKEYCESAGGSFCERPTTCSVAHCGTCKDAEKCSICEEGYMMVYGKCTKQPTKTKFRWLKAHNLLRCVHGVPGVKWLAAAKQSAQEWVDGLTSLKHSDCYNIPPPAGPSGENLAMGYGTPEAAATAWYKEVECCNGLPGCQSGTCTVGHFTAMVWKGVQKIGCATNKDTKITACRYWSGDTLSQDTANMGGGYETNVLPIKKDLQECIDKADAVAAAEVV
eukprot:CAMPEP_0170591110 /NCGR_PEP_ID=MMETSP0224-20130122/12228_1 /TAXON_ID=285029 /ORGANISM="Togula jolla, Strain CCCM 725" /LENGTH=347 /DNA_ID=CAMNT_0010914951 /DNA_START=61 /DNA_END=1104 /DNA_ORIENTATION=-